MAEWPSTLPVAWANGITVILFVAIAAACFLLARDDVIADAPTQARWRDLRWWAALLIFVQLSIYLVFR